MNEYRQYFKFNFNDPELEKDFLDNIRKFGKPVFSNAERSNMVFTVTKNLALRVTRPSGEYKRVLKQISNIDAMSEGYKSSYGSVHFAKSMLTIIKESKSKASGEGSTVMLFNRLKKFIGDFNESNGQFNIVWYDKYRPLAIKH